MAGETKAVLAAYAKPTRMLTGSGLCCSVFSVPLATTEMELADVVNCGFIPAGVTVVAVGFACHDMDSSTGVVNKITIGSTDVATGITAGVLGSVATAVPTLRAVIPQTTTDKTLVSTTFTTAPSGTAAAGTIHVSVWYFSA